MRSLLSLLRTYWDHEPPPLTRPSGTLSPSEGERDGVRGLVHGKGWGEGPFHRIGAANWNPLSRTLSPLLRRGERESTSGMVVVEDAPVAPFAVTGNGARRTPEAPAAGIRARRCYAAFTRLTGSAPSSAALISRMRNF